MLYEIYHDGHHGGEDEKEAIANFVKANPDKSYKWCWEQWPKFSEKEKMEAGNIICDYKPTQLNKRR